ILLPLLSHAMAIVTIVSIARYVSFAPTSSILHSGVRALVYEAPVDCHKHQESLMGNRLLFGASAAALALAATTGCPAATTRTLNEGALTADRINYVLLISIDGMHALDFANCSGESGGAVTCPTLAALAKTGLVYTQASTSKPSDSFPGLTALLMGGSSKSTGAFYDVSYDRALSPPRRTTPYGIPG